MKAITAGTALTLAVCYAWLRQDISSAKLLLPLLLSGGLASVVQSLVENKNVLTIPSRVGDNKFDLGFVADLLIGMVGAFASLVVGLAVLNERFFQDSGVLAGSSGAVTDASKAFSSLLTAIPTWVRIASFGALTGYASRKLLPDLSNKISTMVVGEVNKEVAKQKQNQNENERSQAEIQAMVVQTLKTASQPATAALGGAGLNGNLESVVQEYAEIKIPDKTARTAKKMAIADRMPGMAINSQMTSNDILSQITKKSEEPMRQGWIVAIASLIALAPEPADGDRLIQVAPLAQQDFVRYRILLAIGSLGTRRLLTNEQITQCRLIAQGYLDQGDDALKRKSLSILDKLSRQ